MQESKKTQFVLPSRHRQARYFSRPRQSRTELPPLHAGHADQNVDPWKVLGLRSVSSLQGNSALPVARG